MNIQRIVILAFILIFALGIIAFAAENDSETVKKNTETVSKQNDGQNGEFYFAFAIMAAAVGIGIAAGGCGIGQGIAVSKGLEGIARQPEAYGKIQNLLIIGLAIIESLAIYALVISLIILYANPFAKYFIK